MYTARKYILTGLTFVLIILFFGLYLLYTSRTSGTEKGEILAQPKTRTVVLSPLGVEPKIVYVEKGTTVIFVNKSANSLWLAPVGNELPGFGSAGVINPGQLYSFTFDTVGVWSYQEQTYGKFEGTVVVEDL